MAAKNAPKKEIEVTIMTIDNGAMDICLKGKTPFICAAMSQKVIGGLLNPAPR